MMTAKKRILSTRDLVYIAVCTAIIAICSWISIPLVVPFTLQTFAVFWVLEFLGGKRGTMSIVIYIILAAIGVPVLSGFKGGIGALLGQTGGYILGFIFTGLIYWLFESMFGNKIPVRITALILGLIACYAFGTTWFMVVYAGSSGPIGLGTALSWCVLPFIIPDILKMILAFTLALKLKTRLISAGSVI